MYVLVRRDIPVAQQIVQVGHACLEAGYETYNKYGDINHAHLIVMTVKDELALEMVVENLTVPGKMFFEPDNNMGHSAWASLPVYDEDRNQFKRFRLWK